MNPRAIAKACYLQGEVHRLRGGSTRPRRRTGRRAVSAGSRSLGLRCSGSRRGRGGGGGSDPAALGETTDADSRGPAARRTSRSCSRPATSTQARDACRELRRSRLNTRRRCSARSWPTRVARSSSPRATREARSVSAAARGPDLAGARRAVRGRARTCARAAMRAVRSVTKTRLRSSWTRRGRLFEQLGAAPTSRAVDSLTRASKAADDARIDRARAGGAATRRSGKSNREIASELVISEHTVARHVQNIFTQARRRVADRRRRVRVRARPRPPAWSEMTMRPQRRSWWIRRCVLRPALPTVVVTEDTAWRSERWRHGSSYRQAPTRRAGQAPRAVRHDRHRRRPGGPRRRLPPEEARRAVRDPRRERAHRRLLAHALGLAPPLHAGDATTGCRAGASRRPAGRFPTKDEMADYLEAYAARFELPVRTASRSTVSRRAAIATSSRPASAASRGRPRGRRDRFLRNTVKVPEFARELDPRIVQMHSSEYRDPCAACARRRPARRRRELRRGHRVSSLSTDSPDVALRARRRSDPVPHGSRSGGAGLAGALVSSHRTS